MTPLPRIVRTLALLPLALALHGCEIGPTEPRARELKELEANRRKWASRGVSSYRYVVTNFCFCLDESRGPVAVEVRGGATVSATYLSGGAPARQQPFASMDSVEDLFDTISRALDREPDEVEVVYDPQLGYPRSARFDFDDRSTDEEGGFSVESFQRL